MQFTNVDLNECLNQLFGVRKLAGRGNIAMNVDGSGMSVMGVTRGLNGTASLTARSGAIAGINAGNAARFSGRPGLGDEIAAAVLQARDAQREPRHPRPASGPTRPQPMPAAWWAN